MSTPARLFNRFRPAGINGRLDISCFDEYLRTHLENHTAYGQGLGIYDKSRRVSLLVGKAQLAGCLKVWPGGPLEWDASIQ